LPGRRPLRGAQADGLTEIAPPALLNPPHDRASRAYPDHHADTRLCELPVRSRWPPWAGPQTAGFRLAARQTGRDHHRGTREIPRHRLGAVAGPAVRPDAVGP